ncbi:hypothetical protein [Colwellia sp. PAMC 21821]|uniref:hypothetical protein n=1 Tax=Colwellia sp. PAMC 21821 TaxID=1816219 RepID=UPI0009BFCA0D|nr:hypothetical protein [Colwellia sp. PAMC 21821]ARD44369.1 hypothetical protein A3Q33_08615 [Colwellia sp. PAMC 21821]
MKYNCLAALMLTTLISGCGSDSKSAPTPVIPEVPVLEGKVSFVLASVDGGSCTLLDPAQNMTQLAGPSITAEGVALFEDIAPDTGLVMVECTGGSYEDEATGDIKTPGVLRSYVNITSSEFTATVSPLTEVVARIVDHYELDYTDYATVSTNVAFAFGLQDVDLSTLAPLDTNTKDLDGSPSSHYGLVLAAISQLQVDLELDTAEEVIQELASGLANNGLFTKANIRGLYFSAIENTFNNPRIDRNDSDDELLHKFFYSVALAPIASQVEYVHADHPDSVSFEANSMINAFEPALFDIVGTHLTLHMRATLGGEDCRLRDVQPIVETSKDTDSFIMYAECPEQAAGEADFQIFDHDGRLENTTTITVVNAADTDAIASYNAKNRFKTASNSSVSATPTGSSFILGTVTGQAPLINASVGSAHNYNSASLVTFPIEGVTVQLVDAANQVITSTVTTEGGNYQFNNAPDNTSVSIVVLAEIKKARTIANVGAEYNFAVRDNTSTTSPKKLYQIATPLFTTQSFLFKDLVAKVGFTDSGQAISNEARESAPFAILRSVNTAVNSLEKLDANVSMPDLNIYWSANNVGANGDENLGQIGTSHYQKSGLQPGLFILGKADSDTDEFDAGVLGHEFGHYLQDKLSYADNPGGSHRGNEYKDASLAYGEGYGTAVGVLLSGDQYYCDVAGNSQTGGFCWDLKDKNLAGDVKGFYSEKSIITLMYHIGLIEGKGVDAFFAAMTAMKTTMHSATIFNFLHHYLTANPDVSAQVNTLMAENNIKTSDIFGNLSPNALHDPAISASVNKGNSTTGANDLEVLYLELPLIAVNKPLRTEAPVLLTPNAPTFCVNRNLPGANIHNGLGMRQRFTFTSNFDGWVTLRAENHLGHMISPQVSYFDMREEGGLALPNYTYTEVGAANYHGIVQVKTGKKYSLTHKMFNPSGILNGSECGFKVTLSASFY